MEPEGSLQAANNAIFSNVKPAHAILAYVFKIHFNINLPSTPRSSNCSLSFVCPHTFLPSPPHAPNYR